MAIDSIPLEAVLVTAIAFSVVFLSSVLAWASGVSSRPTNRLAVHRLNDEEFCELIDGVDADLALKVRDVLVDATGWEKEEIHPGTRLIEFEF